MGRRDFEDGHDAGRKVGWQDCLNTIGAIRQSGYDQGRTFAHVDNDLLERVRSETPSTHSYTQGRLFVPYEIRRATYAAGFDEGVAAAKRDAWRIGQLIKMQEAEQAADAEPLTYVSSTYVTVDADNVEPDRDTGDDD